VEKIRKMHGKLGKMSKIVQRSKNIKNGGKKLKVKKIVFS
jgi:hypothetical protein